MPIPLHSPSRGRSLTILTSLSVLLGVQTQAATKRDGVVRKSFRVKAEATDNGIVTAVPSVFGVKDSYGDIMRPGCFESSLKRKLPAVLWMHRGTEIIGKTTEARELAPGDELLPEEIRELGGLYCKAELYLDDAPYAKLAHVALRDGVVDEFSIGYYETKVTYEKDAESDEQHRYTDEVDLVEWSPVHRGANPSTALLDVKEFSSRSMSEQADHALDAVRSLVTRAREVQELRAADGREISPRVIEELISIQSDIQSFVAMVRNHAISSEVQKALSDARRIQRQIVLQD
jgi:uncharacterized protein